MVVAADRLPRSAILASTPRRAAPDVMLVAQQACSFLFQPGLVVFQINIFHAGEYAGDQITLTESRRVTA